jgi:hypothetical protein
MFSSPRRHCIGKHGNAIVEKRTRLDLQIQIVAISTEEEVEAAPSKRHFSTDKLESSKLRNELLLDKMPRHSVRPMSIQEHRGSVSFNRQHGIMGFTSRCGGHAQMKRRAGQKKLRESPRVGEVSYDLSHARDAALDNESIRPFDEMRFPNRAGRKETKNH